MKKLNCKECGAEILNPNQKFCEQCGAKIPLIRETTERTASIPTTQAQQMTYRRPGDLFDINRTYYVLKEKYWDWGGGDILDDKGQIIGKMKRKILSIRKKIELREIDGTVSAMIHEKIISARGAQTLMDSEGNIIARIKKKILTFLKPKFFLEDPDGNRWYEALGKFMGFSFKIKDLSTGKIIAEIEKADRWRDVFLGGMFDFKDTYALKILDKETDRRILLGFVISIDNVMHDH
ncbi:MAG: zinc-ribbon domain-containing protein [Promethearchaeota archaeon]|nr:MAG: zinc-ribbon domain-containing protein [Candidatus Lokiarchaeota archaeon]